MKSEDVYAAIFALLAPLQSNTPVLGDGTAKTISRRLVNIEQMQPSMVPAIYQTEATVKAPEYTTDGIVRCFAQVRWFIYARAVAPASFSAALNPLVDACLQQVKSGVLNVPTTDPDFPDVTALRVTSIEIFDAPVFSDYGFAVIDLMSFYSL